MSSGKNFISVVRREMRQMRKRPIYLISTVVVLAFCCLFFLTFLKDGLPKDLPIGVVDNDRSSLSRNFTRQLDATRLGKTLEFSSYEDARTALQKGEITAFCVIPEGMNDDVLSYRRPTFTFYVNSLYFVGGALAYQDLLTMANLTSAAVQREVLRAKGMSEGEIMDRIQPILIDAHQIGNCETDYSVYLCNMLIPGVLELIIIIVTIYALGSELKYGTSRQLLSVAGGSMTTALAGKLLPYTILYVLLGFVCDLLLYHWLGFPIAGSIGNMFIATLLMVLASEAIAIFITGLLPVLRISLSVGAIYSVLAFSLTGFTFPVEALPAYIQGLAVAYPLRHYYNFFVQEVIFGSDFAGWYPQVIFLLLFLFLPLFVYRRLYKAYSLMNFPRH